MPRGHAAARLGGPACTPAPSAGPAFEVSTVGFLSAEAAGCRALTAAFAPAGLLSSEDLQLYCALRLHLVQHAAAV